MSNEVRGEETILGQQEEGEAETFNPFDDLTESFNPGTVLKVTGSDGLPTQVVPEHASDIPELSPETLVCMGDFSEFFGQNGIQRYAPEDVEQLPDGSYVVKLNPNVYVVPKRLPCVHYVRQVTQLDANPEIKYHARLCALRRSTSGAFMNLSDVAMWACNQREPRDIASERKHIDAFDQQKIQQGAARMFGSIFGPMK